MSILSFVCCLREKISEQTQASQIQKEDYKMRLNLEDGGKLDITWQSFQEEIYLPFIKWMKQRYKLS